MAQKSRPATARMASGITFLTKSMSAISLAAIAYVSTAMPSQSPDFETVLSAAAQTLPARLAYSGTDLIITGSVNHIFGAHTFSGPNRSQKQARVLPLPDVLTHAKGFETARTQMAALRAAKPELGALPPELSDSQRIVIASIDPAFATAALDAIRTLDGDIAPKSGFPEPSQMPERLAYARANTPATVFSTPVSKNVSQKEAWCLATAVYFEARGEPYRGQVAVAQVVMNRVNDKRYPNTICGVVFQNQSRRNACQFSFACDGIPERVTEKKAWAVAEEVAEKITNGSLYLTEVANATHYHANYVYPRWAPRLKRMTRIGLHIFYRYKHT